MCGPTLDDQGVTREESHNLAGGPLRDNDPEHGEEIHGAEPAVVEGVGVDLRAKGGKGQERCFVAPRVPWKDRGDMAQVIVEAPGSPGHGLPAARPERAIRDPLPPQPQHWEVGLVNRRGGCYVLDQNVLVSR